MSNTFLRCRLFMIVFFDTAIFTLIAAYGIIGMHLGVIRGLCHMLVITIVTALTCYFAMPLQCFLLEYMQNVTAALIANFTVFLLSYKIITFASHLVRSLSWLKIFKTQINKDGAILIHKESLFTILKRLTSIITGCISGCVVAVMIFSCITTSKLDQYTHVFRDAVTWPFLKYGYQKITLFPSKMKSFEIYLASINTNDSVQSCAKKYKKILSKSILSNDNAIIKDDSLKSIGKQFDSVSFILDKIKSMPQDYDMDALKSIVHKLPQEYLDNIYKSYIKNDSVKKNLDVAKKDLYKLIATHYQSYAKNAGIVITKKIQEMLSDMIKDGNLQIMQNIKDVENDNAGNLNLKATIDKKNVTEQKDFSTNRSKITSKHKGNNVDQGYDVLEKIDHNKNTEDTLDTLINKLDSMSPLTESELAKIKEHDGVKHDVDNANKKSVKSKKNTHATKKNVIDNLDLAISILESEDVGNTQSSRGK